LVAELTIKELNKEKLKLPTNLKLKFYLYKTKYLKNTGKLG